MTKIDYVILASVLQSTRPNEESWINREKYALWFEIRERLCFELKQDNTLFNMAKFIEATEK